MVDDGRQGRPWRTAHAEFKRQCATQHRPCVLCGHPIDYTLAPPRKGDGGLGRYSFTVHHVPSLQVLRNLGLSGNDPRWFTPAHWSCNSAQQDRPAIPRVANPTSRLW